MPSPPGTPDSLAPGTIVGHFRIVRELGRGAHGVVHLAADREIPDRLVALKSMRGDRSVPPDSLRHEAAALAALQHPNILVVHEVGETPSGGAFLAAELMAGGSLADRLRDGPLPITDGIAIARATADALAAAHGRGIVHRDLKPGNLLFTDDGTVKVADFGIALRGTALTTPVSSPDFDSVGEGTLTLPSDQARGIAGTPLYIPPELFHGAMATAQGDQFAFGVTLHEILAGSSPFDRNAGLRSTLLNPTISTAIPPDLRRIIARCLEQDPKRRFPDMRAVVAALDDARARRSPERKRTLRVALAAPAALLLVFGVWAGARVLRARRAHDLNEEGSRALERGDRDAARAGFVAALAADPDHLPACTNLGTLAGLEANPAWAVTILKSCASRFPGSGVVRYNLGAALRATGDAHGALGELRRALELAADGGLRAPAVNELARALIDTGRADDALALLDREPVVDPAGVEGAVLTKTKGIALLAAGKLDGAVSSLRAALSGALPSTLRPETLVALGQALERSGRASEAAEAFARSIAEGAQNDTAIQALEGLGRVQSQK